MSENRSIDRLDLSRLESLPTLAERLIALCLARNERVVTAESCTAGLLGQSLSCCFGASTAFQGGFLTYTKEAKIQMLGVTRDELASCTAVHRRVALAMATGALARSPSSFAVSITGVTGDTPDEDGNPIGRVIVGYATEEQTATLHCEFGSLISPALNQMAVKAALAFALRQLGDASVISAF